MEGVFRGINFTSIASLVAYHVVASRKAHRGAGQASRSKVPVQSACKVKSEKMKKNNDDEPGNFEGNDAMQASEMHFQEVLWLAKVFTLLLMSLLLGCIAGGVPSLLHHWRRFPQTHMLLSVTVCCYLVPLVTTLAFYFCHKNSVPLGEANEDQTSTHEPIESPGSCDVKSPSPTLSASRLNRGSTCRSVEDCKEAMLSGKFKKMDFSTLTLAGSFSRRQKNPSSSGKKRGSVRSRNVRESPKLDRHPSLRSAVICMFGRTFPF